MINLRKAAVFLAVNIFIISAANAAVSINHTNDLDELQKKLDENAAQKAKITQKLDNAQDDLEDALKKKYTLDIEMNTINKDISEIDNVISEKEAEIQAKTQNIEMLNASIADNKKHLAARMKIIYEHGRFSYLDVILKSKSLSDFFQRTTVINDIVKHDRSLIEQYTSARNEIEASLDILKTEQAEQQTAKNMLDEKKSALDKVRAERNNVISDLKDTIEELEISSEKNEQYEKEARMELIRLMKEMDEAEETAAPNTPETTAISAESTLSPTPETSVSPAPKASASPTPKASVSPTPKAASSPAPTSGAKPSDFGWPSNISKNITSRYGYRKNPVTGEENKLHAGVDIGVSEGTDVLAAKDGTVVTAGWNNSYGYYVTINHGGGTATLYAHNSSLLVETGDKVSKGDPIAKSGSTGNSTGPHIHFEIIVNGETVDPLKYF